MAKGGKGQNVQNGSSDADVLVAELDATKINGGDGDDVIMGGAQADDIRAGDGDDTISGGAGDDTIFGNDGIDTALVSDLSSVSVTAGKGNSWIVTSSDGTDTLKHIEVLSDGTNTYTLGQNNGVFGLAAEAATEEDAPLQIDLLATAFDVEGDSFAITRIDSVSASGASVRIDQNGAATYDAGTIFDSLAEGETVQDSFTYEVTDSAGNVREQTLSMTITGTNDAPVITGGDVSGAITLPTGGGEVEFGLSTYLRKNVVDNTNFAASVDVTALENGNYVVTSNQSNHANNGGKGFVSIVTPDGVETEIYQDDVSGAGFEVVALTGGGFAAAWTTGRFNPEVHIFDADGNLVGSQTITAPYSYADSAIGLTATADGGVALSFRQWEGGGNYDERFVKLGPDAEIEIGPLDLNSADFATSYNTSLTALDGGGYAMLTGYGNDTYKAGVLFLDDAGNVTNSVTFAGENLTDNVIRDGSIEQLANGNLVITFSHSQDGYGRPGFRIIDTDGNEVVGDQSITDTSGMAGYFPMSDAVALQDGGFAIAYYQYYRATDPETGEQLPSGTYVQSYSADGTKSGDAVYVDNGAAPSLDVNADGTLVVATYNGGFAKLTEVTLPSSGPVVGEGDLSASGTVLAEDVDDGALLSFGGGEDAAYGAVTVDGETGEWVYTLDPERFSGSDVPATDSFTVTVTDEFGGTDSQLVSIEIA